MSRVFNKHWKMPEPELPDKEDVQVPSPDPVKPEVDTSSFDKGTKKIHSDMDRITKDVGTDLPEPEPVAPELDSKEFDKQAERMQTNLSRIVREIDRMVSTSTQGFRSTSAVLAFNNKLELTAEKVEEAREKLQEFAEQQIPTDQYAETTASIEKIEAELDKLHEKQARMVMLGEDRPSKQWEDTNAKLEDANRRLNNYVESLRYMEEKGVTGGSVWDEMTEKYNAARQEVDQYEAQLQKLGEGGEAHSKKWRNIELQIKEAEAELENYKAQESNLRESGAAFIDPKATEQYETMLEQIEQAAQAIETNTGLINKEKIEQKEYNVLLAQEKVAHASNAVTRQIALRQLQKAQNELAAVANQSVTPKPDPAAGSAWNRFSSTISKITLGARGAADSIKGIGGKAVKTAISGVKSLASKFTGLFSSIKNNGKGSVDALFKKLTGLKNMLVSRIKRTFISFLFDQIKESFNALAKFDKRFDESVSNLRNRTSELGANIMSAFGGLIRQIEPYITKAIDAMSTGMTKINAMIASLRGEDTMQVAVRRTESYADSLNDSAKSAEKAKEAQEKLNATLTSYDEIHKLDAPKDATAASESGADAEKTVYENVPVESILGQMTDLGRRIAERVADGIKSGNWKDAGRAISDGLNLAVAKLDEKMLALRPKAESAARNIADLLNGMVLGFDGGALGKTIADGLNLALGTANAFLKRFDFYAFGATIGDGITGAVQNFEWETAGETFGNVINGFIDTAKGIIEHTDWNGLGRGFGRGLNRLVETVDWKDAARTMSAGIIGLLDSLSSFLEETDWQDFGAKIYEFLTNVDWSGIAAALMRGAGAVLGALAGFLWGLIKGAMDKVKQWWYDNAYENGEFSMEGLFEGIKKALKSIGTWIKKNIFTPFINGFKKAFGIASPAKEMKPYGEFVGEGVLEGIKSIFSSIGNWITNNIVEPFKNAFKSAFHVVGDKANALIDNGKAIANGVKSGISNGWTSITTFLSGKAGDVKQACEGIADSATSAFSADKFRESGRNIINGVSSGLTDQSAWDQGIGGKIMERIGWIKQAFTGFDESGRRIISGVGEGIGDQSNWDNSIGGRLIERVGWIQDAFDSSNFLQAGRNIVAGLAGGLDEAFQRAQEGTLEGGVATLVAASRRYYSVAANVARPAIDEITAPRELNVRTTEALGEIREVSDAIDDLDNKSVEIKADKAAGALDTIADKLAAIAQIFDNISKAFPDFNALPVPAVATGAFAPARTRVTESDGRTGQEIKQLLQSFIGRITALEEAVAERPIRIEVPVVFDRTEIGKANATYVRTNGEISNGNGGLGWNS